VLLAFKDYMILADLQTAVVPTPIVVLLKRDYRFYEGDKYLECKTAPAITDYWKDYNIRFERLK